MIDRRRPPIGQSGGRRRRGAAERAETAIVLAAGGGEVVGDRTVVVRHAGGVRPTVPVYGARDTRRTVGVPCGSLCPLGREYGLTVLHINYNWEVR